MPCPPGFGLRPGCALRGVEEFTIADAEQAKLTGKDNWRNYTRAILYARAITEGQRAYAPNLWGGLKNYCPDEMGSEDPPAEVVNAEVIDSEETVTVCGPGYIGQMAVSDRERELQQQVATQDDGKVSHTDEPAAQEALF